eukprot:s2640_g9.t2
MNDELPKLAEMIHGDTVNEGGVSYDDITLWPTLRRLTIVKGIKWPEKLRSYLLYMEDVCDAAKLDGDAEEIATLRQEIQIQRRLIHQNIVRLLYAAETPREVLKIEHFASGGDLHAALGCRRIIPEVQAVRLCEQLLCGLRYLHEDEFVLHGDVKPRNIFLVPAGDAMVVQLGDFGFARECPRKAPFLCRFEGIQGSHGYIAPEILAEEAYGFGVDIFALGAECFVTGLLQQRPEERFTAAAALAHEWFALFGDDDPVEKPSTFIFIHYPTSGRHLLQWNPELLALNTARPLAARPVEWPMVEAGSSWPLRMAFPIEWAPPALSDGGALTFKAEILAPNRPEDSTQGQPSRLDLKAEAAECCANAAVSKMYPAYHGTNRHTNCNVE